jgi:hypothetical protein
MPVPPGLAANLTGRNIMTYETPEVLEIGAAATLTLGRPNLTCDDACDCTKSGDVVVSDAADLCD